MKDVILIGGQGSISKSIFAQSLASNIIIVDFEKKQNTFDNTPTMIIRNYSLANKCIQLKTGKELRRERRKNMR